MLSTATFLRPIETICKITWAMAKTYRHPRSAFRVYVYRLNEQKLEGSGIDDGLKRKILRAVLGRWRNKKSPKDIHVYLPGGADSAKILHRKCGVNLNALVKIGQFSVPWESDGDGFRVVGRLAVICREMHRSVREGWWRTKVDGPPLRQDTDTDELLCHQPSSDLIVPPQLRRLKRQKFRKRR